MTYQYQAERPRLFTEEGQVMFLKIRDRVHRLIQDAGAFDMFRATLEAGGDSWMQLACVDRLVELGEIKELTVQGQVPGQYRVFTSKE